MVCAVCLALEFGPDDSLRALVVYQAAQLERLTGGTYTVPAPAELTTQPAEEAVDDATPDALFVVESLLGHEDIWRRPSRVAAPRLVERLAAHGYVVVPLSHPSARMSEPGAAQTAPARGQPCVGGST